MALRASSPEFSEQYGQMLPQLSARKIADTYAPLMTSEHRRALKNAEAQARAAASDKRTTDTAERQDWKRGLEVGARSVGGRTWVDPKAPPSPDDAKHMKDSDQAMDKMLGSLDRLERLFEENGTEAFGAVASEMEAEWKNITDQVRMMVASTLEQVPGQMAKVQAAREAFEAAASARASDIARRSSELLEEPFKREVMPRLATYATRMIPPIVGASTASALGGGAAGAIAGGIIGTGVGAAMGAPGTALRNLLRSPGFRKLAHESVKRIAVEAPASLGRWAPVLARGVLPEQIDRAVANAPDLQEEWDALLARVLPTDTNSNESEPQ